jgi:diguanylate cyclase (GGDEF)-like protein
MMDIKTMVMALALGNLSLCAALFFFELDSKKTLAISTWQLAKQCQAAAWFLLFFRGTGVIPDLISIPFGYSLLFAGVALDAGAMWEAAERPLLRRALLLALAPAIAVYVGVYFIDEAGVRMMVGSLLLCGFYLAAVGALLRPWPQASSLRRFLIVSMSLLALVVALRGALLLAVPDGYGWISQALVQMLATGALFLLMMLGSFGFLLLTREQLQRELARQAVVDLLTDVPNRRGFFNVLTPWMSLARRPGLPTALIVFDLDDFKRVNDSYGHPVGDSVMRSVVEICKRQLRDSDQLGRMGGAEFAVVLPRTGLGEALLVAERIRAALEQSPIKSERVVINITASLGVTILRPDDSTVSLFKRADEAVRTAKANGRNKVVEAVSPATLAH